MAGLPNYLIILLGLSICKTVKFKLIINIFIYTCKIQHLPEKKAGLVKY